MSFPEFDPAQPSLLFFCRGRGRGHAIPDIEIARHLQALRPDVQIHFVSYGTGARTLEQFGHTIIDLDLPDANPLTETTVLAGRLIGWLQPDLVVVHEEYAALPAAKIFSKPTVCITDFFGAPGSYSTGTLNFADRILFLDHPGIAEAPEWLADRVEYFGPVLREFRYGPADRARARQELGLAPDALVLTVLPGSWTEALAPAWNLVTGACALLPERRLLWLADADYDELQAKGLAAGVTVLQEDWTIERLMVASDLVITKGSRTTLAELTALGVKSLSLSYGINPADDRRAPHYPGNGMLPAAELTAASLSDAIAEALAGAGLPVVADEGECAAQRIARRLLASVPERLASSLE